MTSAEKKRKGEEHRERMARRMRDFTASVSDIGELPKVKDRKRRKGCELDLHKFLVTYFPNSTGLSPFSSDHERVIRRIQHCVLEGGRFVNAVYRGFAKTTISENAAVWATVYGHRRFVPVFGADAPTAQASIESIKLELSENDLLYEDFPEVCHAVRALEGKAQRRVSQSYKGQRTFIDWSADRVVLPTIPGSKASGAVLCARGITGGFRGMKVKSPDGTQQRPDFIILDDPQTDESARSPLQVAKTLTTLRKAVVKLGGHRRQIAVVINATVIEQDDAIDRLLADPAWQGERIPLVRKFPAAHKTMWLGKYAELRRNYDKDDPEDQRRAHREATAYYRANRAAMDEGGEVSWPSCFDPDTEISALQHAYNALIDDGEESFASEYQIRPLPKNPPQPDDLAAEQVMARVNGCKRGLAPAWATRLTAFIDVQKDLLPWCVAAWGDGFRGGVVDYGAWPDQAKPYWSLADARPTVSAATGIGSLEGSLWAALQALTGQLLGRAWPQDGGAEIRVERCLIDAKWGESTELVRRFCRASPHAAVLLPSMGLGITADKLPLTEWPKKDGERRGLHWVIRPPQPGRPRQLLYDANFWKSYLHARLAQPVGEAGALTLFGDEPSAHRLLADHFKSEYRTPTFGRNRQVHVWAKQPNRENHLLDCLAGNCVAASVQGVALGASGERTRAGAKPAVDFAELVKRNRAMKNGRGR